MLTNKPKGTNDFLPDEVGRWQALEDLLREVSRLYGYREIRTPIFEHTELFQRGVGETTDIVEKEMYTFTSKGEKSYSLRPEGTAPTVRAYVENKLYAQPQPTTKLYYIGPMFRHDRPQAGRYRQFHQYGIEALGSDDPALDAEVIAMAMDIYRRLGLKDLTVELNSVGCPNCRLQHRQKLQEFLAPKKEQLCKTCQGRYERNPMRILDCKDSNCQKLTEGAPTIDQMLCPECQSHFTAVQKHLHALEVPYNLNSKLVRGLDYYVKTAFEIVATGIGAQGSVGGGGRYDGLIEQIGGPAMPGIGFALGLERILLAMKEQGLDLVADNPVEVFIATMGEDAQLMGSKLSQQLRQEGFAVERDYGNRSFKAQLKAADRYQVRYTLIIGEDELKNNMVQVKDMATGKQEPVALAEVQVYLNRNIRGREINE
ncbi:MAG: histidine--tRNA ligase [Peptococcia bacterium]